MRVAVLACLVVACGCASAGDPPGGPPDREPPRVLRVEPESGTVLAAPPSEANIYFDEVIEERVAAQPPDIASAVILSPTSDQVRVAWHRDRISVRPRTGFQSGRVYRLELLPVITDLRTNKMRAGRTVIFSTGPPIPDAVVEGTVVDWIGGKPAVRALVEAVLMPDSLVYRALADSGGVFRLAQIPPGHYRLYGVMDTNNDRRRGPREMYDSLSVDVDTTGAPVELFAFPRDTTGPRLRQVEVVDSLTMKLTFDRALDPTLALDTSRVMVATLEDSTTGLPLVAVYTQKTLDSLTGRAADSATTARRVPADSTPRALLGIDSSRGAVRVAARPGAQPPAIRPGAVRGGPARPETTRPAGRAPLDSTRADKMLARRPPPTDVRLIRLAEPLVPETRYVVYVLGARSLSGIARDSRGQVRAPKPPAPPPARPGARHPDSLRADSSARDSLAAPAARDTTRTPPRRP